VQEGRERLGIFQQDLGALRFDLVPRFRRVQRAGDGGMELADDLARGFGRRQDSVPKLDCAILARLPDKQSILGVLDLGAMAVETPALVAEHIRRALAYVAPKRLIVAPDCGLK
jgi:Cobalamin-independent synthase, Catalytic domain